MATPPEVDQDQNMYLNFDSKGPYISIPQFYAARSVFITGGTGFMGKVKLQFIFYVLNWKFFLIIQFRNCFLIAGVSGETVAIMSRNSEHLLVNATQAWARSVSPFK